MEILKYLRRLKNLSQQDLAGYLNVTPQAYGNYETGRRQIDIDTLRKLAEFYHVTTDYILGFKLDDGNQGNVRIERKSGERVWFDLDNDDLELVEKFIARLQEGKKD